MSLQRQGGAGFALGTAGATPQPVLQSTVLNLNYSSRVATRLWGPDDPTGGYVAYIVLTRPGLSPLAPANWLGIAIANFTVGP